MKKRQDQTFSAAQVARLCGIDPRTASGALSGVPAATKGKRATYRLEDALPAVVRHFRERRMSEREQLTRAQRRKVEFELAREQGRYVPAADVERDTAAMIGQAKCVLTEGVRTLPPQLAGESQLDTERILKEWVFASLTKLHQDPLGSGNLVK